MTPRSHCALFVACALAACGASHDVPIEGELTHGDTADQAEVGTFSFEAIGAPVALELPFKFPEGPVWSAREEALYFADITADAIYRLKLPDELETLVQPAQHPDGLALDPEGGLVVAGFGSRTLWKLDGNEMKTLADTYQGQKLNSPDDLVIRSDGTIYVTDPTFGIDGSQGLARGTAELTTQGVFRLDKRGELHLEDMSQGEPNGIALSPDEHTLYVSYTSSSEIDAFSVAEDGALGDKRVFATGVLAADSMTVDAAGDLYVASVTGFSIFAPDGSPLGAITVPQATSNISFGGPDQRTLFVTARDFLVVFGIGAGKLYRIDNMPVRGIPGRP
jgi:gluconolactonase